MLVTAVLLQNSGMVRRILISSPDSLICFLPIFGAQRVGNSVDFRERPTYPEIEGTVTETPVKVLFAGDTAVLPFFIQVGVG